MASPLPTVRVELSPYSMFAATPTYQIQAELDTGKENVIVFGLKRDVVVPDPSDILFPVPTGGGGRLDLISQKFYSTPELWWVIARCNPSIDPMVGPSITDIVHVPTRLRLAALGVLNV